MSKGEKWKTYCHQCQRGRLLEIWLQQRWRRWSRLSLMAIDCFWRTDAETRCNTNVNCRNTSANCCNTNANTDAEKQCWNSAATQKLTQMVKDVIDGYNRRMTQMIKIVYTNTDAATPMLKRRCWNTTVGPRMLKHDCWKRTQMLQHKSETCWNVDAETRLLDHECWNTTVGSKHRCCNTKVKQAET